VKGIPNPRPDLPFPQDVIDYCSRRLMSLGIPPDREWLKGANPTIVDALTGGDQAHMAAEARRSVPRSPAVWESSDFYRSAMPLAIFDVRFEPMKRFEHFELLYVRILGEDARPWIPSLYLAAVAAPYLTEDCRVECIQRFDPERLRATVRIFDDE
jgi:hypothetical protein